MPVQTQFEQERHVESISGTIERYVIINRIVVPGALPHGYIFVMKVNVRADPKADTFQRIGRISDLVTLSQGRDAGLLANPNSASFEYLSNSVLLGYPDLTTAINAETVTKDRVNKLVNDWVTFSGQFNAPAPTPAEYFFPAVPTSTKLALIQTYTTAKQLRYQKQLAAATATDDLTEANAALANANTLLNALSPLSSAVASVSSLLGQDYSNLVADQTAETTFLAAANAFLTAAACALTSDKTTFQTAVTAFQAQVLAAGNNVATFTAHRATYATMSAQLAALFTSANTSQVAAGAAAITLNQANTQAQTDLATAQANEAAALTAVLAVCPDFIKTTIPLLPSD